MLDTERQAYLSCDAAWHTLTTAVARMEKDAAATKGGYGVRA
jgi:hypothetical protein